MKLKINHFMILLIVVGILCALIFYCTRYALHLMGFSSCQFAYIESVCVESDRVKIDGRCPGIYPKAFIAYHAEEIDGSLYVGFTYSDILGTWIHNQDSFQVEIPTENQIHTLYMRSGDYAYQIWPN